MLAEGVKADLSLLEAARGLDKQALVAIFDEYAPELYNYALRLCGNPVEADNTVGDVFTKFLEQLAAGKGPTVNLQSYLYRMTYHLVVDRARLSRREAPIELVDTEPAIGREHPSLHVTLEKQMLIEAVMLAIQNDLTADQRNVIILRFVEGLSLLEIAEVLGKGLDNVKVIQSRAIAKLRKVLHDRKVSL